MPAQETLEHVVTGSEHVSHIVKESEAEAFPEVGQADRGKAEFLTVDEQRGATNGKAGIGIARPCLIQPETAMRVAAPGKKKFGQGDDGNVRLTGRLQIIERTGPWGQDSGATIDLLQAEGSRAGEDEFMIRPTEGVIGGILGKGATIV